MFRLMTVENSTINPLVKDSIGFQLHVPSNLPSPFDFLSVQIISSKELRDPISAVKVETSLPSPSNAFAITLEIPHLEISYLTDGVARVLELLMVEDLYQILGGGCYKAVMSSLVLG